MSLHDMAQSDVDTSRGDVSPHDELPEQEQHEYGRTSQEDDEQ